MEESATLAEKLAFEGDKLFGYLDGFSPEDWAVEVYAEGERWTARSILAHLMTTERAFLKLFRRIREGGPGVSADFMIDRYNASQQRKTEGVPPGKLLQDYREARGQMVELVRSLGAPELDRVERHPFLGVTSLREMIKMVYIHNQTHYRDIRRALRRSTISG